LKCYTGQGNTAQSKNLREVACPNEAYFVCMKKFGRDLGDQIIRKCVKLTMEK